MKKKIKKQRKSKAEEREVVVVPLGDPLSDQDEWLSIPKRKR